MTDNALSSTGRRGGRSRSPAKLAACQRNFFKAHQPRWYVFARTPGLDWSVVGEVAADCEDAAAAAAWRKFKHLPNDADIKVQRRI